MGIREDYKRWPLERQLQVTFIGTSFVIVVILMIITQFQLDWLRSGMVSKSENVINDILKDQMVHLGREKSGFILEEFKSYINFISSFKAIELLILGQSSLSPPPIIPEDPIWSADIPSDIMIYSNGTLITLETGVFFTRFSTVSDEGEELMASQAAMDKLFPLMFRDNFALIYAGFKTDELIHFYPGYKFSDSDYSPITREWYYKAYDSPNDVIITQPYQDSETKAWMITISTALLIDGEVYGVTGADITLTYLTSIVNNVSILETGFLLVVTSEGLVLCKPTSWNYLGDPLRIYDETTTGISENKWNSLIEGDLDELKEFTDINGTDYYITITEIAPYDNLSNVTHYLCVCVKQSEAYQPVQDMEDSYHETYLIIFWVVLAIAIVTFLSIAILIHLTSKKLGRHFKEIEKVFAKIVNRGLFPDITKRVSLEKIEDASKVMPGLILGCAQKVETLKKMEDEFLYFDWGATRPCDRFLFQDWTDKIYPFNLYHGKEMTWRPALTSLTKVSAPNHNLFS